VSGKARNCICGQPIRADGFCRSRCDPALKPSALAKKRAQAKRKLNAARAENERAPVTAKDMSHMSARVATFDPIAAHLRQRSLRANRKSHSPGARRR
jgi:hypothetical protein